MDDFASPPGHDPYLLTCLQRFQALAQSGLTYCSSPYDKERYEEMRDLCVKMVATAGTFDSFALDSAYRAQLGYATPKIDVRGAVFVHDRILMVREVLDNHRWTLPGGWADVGHSPTASIVKEVHEESGYRVQVDKLAALWDRRVHHPGPTSPFHIWKHFYICSVTGGEPTTSIETSEVGFFAEDEIPADLSLARVTPAQIARMFVHHRSPNLPTELD
jgi:ADP-ribose pyrophosphatase YjhB (NUDIX family)